MAGKRTNVLLVLPIRSEEWVSPKERVARAHRRADESRRFTRCCDAIVGCGALRCESLGPVGVCTSTWWVEPTAAGFGRLILSPRWPSADVLQGHALDLHGVRRLGTRERRGTRGVAALLGAEAIREPRRSSPAVAALLPQSPYTALPARSTPRARPSAALGLSALGAAVRGLVSPHSLAQGIRGAARTKGGNVRAA